MHGIIETLLHIDQTAARVTEQAERERAGLPRDIAAESSKIKARGAEETRRALLALREAARKQTDEQIAAIHARQKAREAALLQDFEENRGRWAREIFEAVVHGGGIPCASKHVAKP